MKIPLRFLGVILLLIPVLLVGVSLTQAQGEQDSDISSQPPPSARLPWTSQYVQHEPDRDVGRFVSMALRPFDDFPAISYYDATNTALMLAIPVPGHLGNCGTNNNWLCDTLDGQSLLESGKFSSIDIWGYSVYDWKLGISYYDELHRALKAAIWTCSSGSCVKDIVTVSAADDPDEQIGYYSSLKFDSYGNAGIAYFITTTPYNFSGLYFASQVSNSGNCGVDEAQGFWECSLISILNREGRYISLDFSFDDIPYIAYYSVYDHQLRLAYYESSGSAFCENMGWTCLVIDGNPLTDAGQFASLVAPQSTDGPYHIAYLDITNKQLKYYDSSVGIYGVDDMSSADSHIGISLQIDADGYPVIAYQYIASDFSPTELRIARPYAAYGEGSTGNCGDALPPYFVHYWRCKTIDSGGQYADEADYASLVINSNGRVAVAYTEYDPENYYMSLKFIYQTLFRSFMPIAARH